MTRTDAPWCRVANAVSHDSAAACIGASSLSAILAHLTRPGGPVPDPSAIGAVGHRVVHGGERLIAATRIDDKVEQIIGECAVFAPLHNPVNLAGIRAAREVFPSVPHVAVFDTAFHAQLPAHAYTYAVPGREIAVARRLARADVPNFLARPKSHQELSPWTEEDYRRLGLTPEPRPGGPGVVRTSDPAAVPRVVRRGSGGNANG